MNLVEGRPFECTMCGKCCRWEGVVNLEPEDIRKLAHHLSLPLKEFTGKYTEASGTGLLVLVNKAGSKDCIFLKDNKCEVYDYRPHQCVRFPEKYESRCPGFKDSTSKEGSSMSKYEEAVKKMNAKFSSMQDIYEKAVQDNLYADLQKGVKTASVAAAAVEDGIDGYFDAGRIKVASLDDLFAFNRVDDKHLIHKSTKDLWTIEADNGGEVHIARLFDDKGDPIKG